MQIDFDYYCDFLILITFPETNKRIKNQATPIPAPTMKTPLRATSMNTGVKRMGERNWPINPNVPRYELNLPRKDAGTISPIHTMMVGMIIP